MELDLKVILYIDQSNGDATIGIVNEIPKFQKIKDLSIIVTGRHIKPKSK